jgi:hypothetical protein
MVAKPKEGHVIKPLMREVYPDSDFLRSNFFYSPITGRLFRRDKYGRVKASCIQGRCKFGYISAWIDGKPRKVHILAWIYHYRTKPSLPIDHINGNPSGNRISNLRCVSHRVNSLNCKPRKKRRDLPTGVHMTKGGRYQAYITVNYVKLHLGCFGSAEDASQCYQKARATAMQEALEKSANGDSNAST